MILEPPVRQEPSSDRQIGGYFRGDARFPFCKGCSHTTVLRRLNEALVSLRYPPQNVALVTDIGCIGLADGLFESVHTVHTTHGRSTAFATGLAVADSLLAGRTLKPIVLIGDGGAMIGIQHLIHAAMLNVDITVLICNNFVYGMTGGQGSSFTPEEFVTATTPRGNIVPPANVCEILRFSNAPFVARLAATDRELTTMIRQAIEFPGFAAVEILELCTEFAVPGNELTGAKLTEGAQKNGWKMGLLVAGRDRKQFADRYERGKKEESRRKPGLTLGRSSRSGSLRKPVSILIAGSAGEGVQSAASVLCNAALQENLYVTQKNDNPVTQGSGFSLSELWLSPRPVEYTGIEEPDLVLVVSDHGAHELKLQGWLKRLAPKTRVYMDETIKGMTGDGHIRSLPLRASFSGRMAAMGGVAVLALKEHLVPLARLLQLARERYGEESGTVLEGGLERLAIREPRQ